MPKEKYYILSLRHSQAAEYLYFLIDDEETKGVSLDLQKACVVFNRPKEHDDNLLYVPVRLVKELDREVTVFEQWDEVVFNVYENRKKLNLKYKDGLLVRSTGEGVEEDYVLLLDCATKNNLTLFFMDKTCDFVETIFLSKAGVGEAPSKGNSMYIPKSKVEALATKLPNGSLVLLNCDKNLKELGLEYVGGVLYKKEEGKIEQGGYYAINLNENKPQYRVVRFDGEESLTTKLNEAAKYEAPLTKGSEWTYFVAIDLIDKLSREGYLMNSEAVLTRLGLYYNEDGLLRVIQEEEAPEFKEENNNQERKEQEASTAAHPSLMKVCMNLYGLYQELKKVKNLNQSKTAYSGINDLADQIHQVNREKGFWDKERNVGEMLMLVTSELGEAMEAHRKGKFADWKGYSENVAKLGAKTAFKVYIKDSFEDEIADASIRLLDMAAGLNIDLEKHIQAKLDYNRTRERFHGKEY